MATKKVTNRAFLWGAVVVSFALAILDMFFLRDVLKNILHSLGGASVAALVLATAANVAALLWGRQKGLRDSWKSFMFGWVFLGVAYAVIRSIPIIENIGGEWDFDTVMEQVVPAIVLAISYIGTGSMLQWAGAKLWDIDTVNYLESKKAFKQAHSKIVGNRAIILEMAKRLGEYQNNYDTLNHQYDIHMEKIRKNEHSTMSLIVAKTIADHPEISPTAANAVMDEVLEDRDRRNERAHSKQK